MPDAVAVARVYDPPDPAAGARLLVDRLWPRGLSAASLALDHWAKEVAPSDALRRWVHADPARWDTFQSRYRAELDAAPQAAEICLGWCRAGPVVLLTATRDRQRTHALVLRDYLIERLNAP